MVYAIRSWLHQQDKEWYRLGIRALIPCWCKAIEQYGQFVEKKCIYKVRFSQYYVLFSRILNKYLASKECGALLCTSCRTVVGPTQETLWIVYCLCLLAMGLLPDGGVHLTWPSQYLSNNTNMLGVSWVCWLWFVIEWVPRFFVRCLVPSFWNWVQIIFLGLTVQGEPVLYLPFFLWQSVWVNSTLFHQNGDWWTDGNVCACMIVWFLAACLHQRWWGGGHNSIILMQRHVCRHND